MSPNHRYHEGCDFVRDARCDVEAILDGPRLMVVGAALVVDVIIGRGNWEKTIRLCRALVLPVGSFTHMRLFGLSVTGPASNTASDGPVDVFDLPRRRAILGSIICSHWGHRRTLPGKEFGGPASQRNNLNLPRGVRGRAVRPTR